MPAPQTDEENCVAHNGSLIPVPGRDIMVQAWYQGGVSVFDFTDSTRPFEIAYFDRGPIDAKQLFTGGYWSTYRYNGHIYGTEIARGLDVFKLTASEFLTQNEIDAATAVNPRLFNAQQQMRVTWPANPAVAKAYLDQLTRSKAIAADRAAAVKSRHRARRPGAQSDGSRRAGGSGAVEDADRAARTDAAAATGRDAVRLRALAARLNERAAASSRGEAIGGPA